MRNTNFDLLKGSLIILMIIGHFLQGALTENIGRYLIYSFHMPVFIAVSGYFFSQINLKEIGLFQLFSKYIIRLIIPWLIAVFAYLIYLQSAELFSANGLLVILKKLQYPYYHLWYVSGFLSWVLLSFVASRLRIGDKTWLLISLFISVLSFVLKEHRLLWVNFESLKQVIETILFTFRPHFYVFFVLGMYLKKHTVIIKDWLSLLMISFSLVVILFTYFLHQQDVYIFAFYILNMILIPFLINKAAVEAFPTIKVIEWIGVNSLAIYLWHQFFLLFAEELSKGYNEIITYLFAIIFSVIGIAFVFMLSKVRIINHFVFGIIEKRK